MAKTIRTLLRSRFTAAIFPPPPSSNGRRFSSFSGEKPGIAGKNLGLFISDVVVGASIWYTIRKRRQRKQAMVAELKEVTELEREMLKTVKPRIEAIVPEDEESSEMKQEVLEVIMSRIAEIEMDLSSSS